LRRVVIPQISGDRLGDLEQSTAAFDEAVRFYRYAAKAEAAVRLALKKAKTLEEKRGMFKEANEAYFCYLRQFEFCD